MGVKTYSDPSYIFSGVKISQRPTIYASAFLHSSFVLCSYFNTTTMRNQVLLDILALLDTGSCANFANNSTVVVDELLYFFQRCDVSLATISGALVAVW